MPETAFAISSLEPLPWSMRSFPACPRRRLRAAQFPQKLRLIREGCASGIQEWLQFHVDAGTVPLASQIPYALLSKLFRNKFGGVAVASRSRTIGITVRLRRLTIRGPNSTRYKSRQSSWYSVKTRSMMRRRTAETNCSPPQWLDNSRKTFRSCSPPKVQIIETDGF